MKNERAVTHVVLRRCPPFLAVREPDGSYRLGTRWELIRHGVSAAAIGKFAYAEDELVSLKFIRAQ